MSIPSAKTCARIIGAQSLIINCYYLRFVVKNCSSLS